MNPLDMTGPEFLRFYLVYGLCGLAVAGLLKMLWDRNIAANAELRWAPGYYPRDSDAYGIAMLRGGRTEAVRTLLSRLLAAGFVAFENGEVVKKEESQDPSQLSPLEQLSLRTLAPRQTAVQAEIAIEKQAWGGLDKIQQDLENQGLAPSGAARKRLSTLLTLTLFAVPGLGLAKLWVAMGRHKPNIGFLIILLVLYTAATLALFWPRRLTPAGRRYLAWLQDSHKGLRDLLASGRREDAGETALAAGIFGLAALPMMADLSLAQARRRQPQDLGQNSGSGSGCGGSSCSSGGSSCSGGGSSCGGGSGCGGGGCGGGGCGGCGS